MVHRPNTTFLMASIAVNSGFALKTKKELPTMTRSTKMSTRPSEMLWYLFTMAAMISVPPVLPLCRKTMASDKPVNRQPMMSDMKSCPSPSTCTILPFSPIIQSCASARNTESMMMA